MPNQPSKVERTGRIVKRLCLVLDCLLPHDFSTATSDFVNLQHYVIKEKKLMEKEAVVIFYDIVRIVDNLHKVGLGIPFLFLLEVVLLLFGWLVGCCCSTDSLFVVNLKFLLQ